MAGQGFPYEGSDSRIDPFGILKFLQNKFSYAYEPRPIVWTWKRFWFARWFHNDPDGEAWRIHRIWHRSEYGEDSWPDPDDLPKSGPSDPVGWLSYSFTPSFYIALNFWLPFGRTLHAHYGGRYMRAKERKLEEHGYIIRPSITIKVVRKAFVW